MGNLLQFVNHLPEPTFDRPDAQVDWIFQQKMALYENDDTKNNYRNGLAFYKKFLRQTSNYNSTLEEDPRFHIQNEWDVLALKKVRQWIEATNIEGTDAYLTSYSIVSNMSAIRQVMEHAYELSLINRPVINVALPPAVRETSMRTAFSPEEYENIFDVVGPMIIFSKGLLHGYQRTGKGRDPRKLERKTITRGEKVLGQGWSCNARSYDGNGYVIRDDNMRWYFENEMNSIPLPGTPENKKHHASFFKSAANIHGGLNNLYRKWGVTSFIDQDVVMPLVVELIAVTGLNVEALFGLKRDCFKESHPLTGLPYLEYYKPRSGGEKELHISLYDKAEDVNRMGLGQLQSRIISKTIETIQQVTESLVQHASEEDRNYLFLYKSSGGNCFGRVQRINTKVAITWTNKIVKDYDLRDSDGLPLTFTLSRFRPTKITEMVSQGYDFFNIMALAGHSSITTTLAYVDKLKAIGDFHRKLEREITIIKNNKREYEHRPLPIAIARDASPGEFIFEGPVCHCKNPYNPPDVIKRSKHYHEGDACTLWNMCLQCENVLITEMNLPKLFAYRNHIVRALGNVSEIPRQGELYKKMKMILDEILSPDVLFSKDILEWAAEIAGDEEFEILDSFIYRGDE
jgi:hypothetical protein